MRAQSRTELNTAGAVPIDCGGGTVWPDLYELGGEANLTRVRLAVIGFLLVLVIWMVPESWGPWVYGAVLIAAMGACLKAIFFTKRTKPWKRRERS